MEKVKLIFAPDLVAHLMVKKQIYDFSQSDLIEGYVALCGDKVIAALMIIRNKPHDPDVHVWVGSHIVLRPQILKDVYECIFTKDVLRVSAEINEGNSTALKFVEKLGFVREGFKRHGIRNGDHKVIMGLTREKVMIDG